MGSDTAVKILFPITIFSREPRCTVSHRVVSIIVLDDIIVISKIDVVNSAVNTRRVDKKTFRLTDSAAPAGPSPDRIWRTDRLGWLQPRKPRGTSFDQSIFDREHHYAVTVDVVHNRITYRDIADAVLSRCSIDDNPGPLGGVVSRDAVNHNVIHLRSPRCGEHHKPCNLGLRLSRGVVNDKILQDESS